MINDLPMDTPAKVLASPSLLTDSLQSGLHTRPTARYAVNSCEESEGTEEAGAVMEGD
jgi:hypothetical protein